MRGSACPRCLSLQAGVEINVAAGLQPCQNWAGLKACSYGKMARIKRFRLGSSPGGVKILTKIAPRALTFAPSPAFIQLMREYGQVCVLYSSSSICNGLGKSISRGRALALPSVGDGLEKSISRGTACRAPTPALLSASTGRPGPSVQISVQPGRGAFQKQTGQPGAGPLFVPGSQDGHLNPGFASPNSLNPNSLEEVV